MTLVKSSSLLGSLVITEVKVLPAADALPFESRTYCLTLTGRYIGSHLKITLSPVSGTLNCTLAFSIKPSYRLLLYVSTEAEAIYLSKSVCE